MRVIATTVLKLDGRCRASVIGLEEHFVTPEMARLNGINLPPGVPHFDIMDVGAGRIARMDEAGLKIQVLSALTHGPQNLPGQQGVVYARKLNDQIATEFIGAYPDRAAGTGTDSDGGRPGFVCNRLPIRQCRGSS
ncbi:MAG: hypothetical protein GJ676_00435 [Rhodobacteraceae bacterium]|nr:hypothetical protein [Paracoccaceae bacterium]